MSDNIFDVTHLNYQIEHQTILSDLSFSIKAESWTCVIGPNGAGKSSLLKHLAGLIKAEGVIKVKGLGMNQYSKRQLAQKLSWLGQNELNLDEIPVKAIVMLGRIPHQSWLATPNKKDFEAVERAMEITQCREWKERTLKQLSAGEKQRVLLARSLAVEAEIALMDEPLLNLDLPHQVDWLRQVQQMTAEKKTVVSVLHEIGIALHADEIIILEKGKILHQGPSTSKLTHQAIEQVFQHRIRIVPVEKEWVIVPVLPGG